MSTFAADMKSTVDAIIADRKARFEALTSVRHQVGQCLESARVVIKQICKDRTAQSAETQAELQANQKARREYMTRFRSGIHKNRLATQQHLATILEESRLARHEHIEGFLQLCADRNAVVAADLNDAAQVWKRVMAG